MNPVNHASLSSSQTLYDNDIILNTDFVWWNVHHDSWSLRERMLCGELMKISDRCIPAPSMFELWHELPPITILTKMKNATFAYVKGYSHPNKPHTNPTDALADLLLWVKIQDDIMCAECESFEPYGEHDEPYEDVIARFLKGEISVKKNNCVRYLANNGTCLHFKTTGE